MTRTAVEDYNGWTNRDTWAVALWLGNDEPLYRALQRFAALGAPSPARARAWFARTIRPMMSSDAERETRGYRRANWAEIVADVVMPERAS